MNRHVAVLALVGIFAFSIILGGCGKLSKQEFEDWKGPYVEQNQQEHQELGNKLTNLDGKVTQQGDSLKDAISQAKDEAIANAQQGDADTIAAAQTHAKEQVEALRPAISQAASAAEQRAKDSAKTGDDGLRQSIRDLEGKINSQSSNVTRLQNELTTTKNEATAAVKAAASQKPSRVATVHFGSGKSSLTAEAKMELDKAVTAIRAKSSYAVKVIGHADGSPVLGGRYQSNWALSEARAAAVETYLKEKGVGNTIETVARAHTQPVAAGKTKDGRMKNRRVEVIIYPPGDLR